LDPSTDMADCAQDKPDSAEYKEVCAQVTLYSALFTHGGSDKADGAQITPANADSAQVTPESASDKADSASDRTDSASGKADSALVAPDSALVVPDNAAARESEASGRVPNGRAIAEVLASVAGPIDPCVFDEIDQKLIVASADCWAELSRARALVDPSAAPPRLMLPSAIRRMIAHAIAELRREGDARAGDLVAHYLERMPRMRVEQLAAAGTVATEFFHARLDWAQLPRLAGALDRLYALLADAGVDPRVALGAATPGELRAAAPTLAALYDRTHYGAAMPLLYGYPQDLAYFHARGFSLHEAIDRYLTAPFVHELCHLARDRDALPPHLDECIGGWLGVHVWPELAYPVVGHDDALFAAPWLAQVGQAVARGFGVRATIHAYSTGCWPTRFLEASVRLAWQDWRSRRTLHLLSDTFAPEPWVALGLAAGAGRSLEGETLASLARLPLVSLAAELPEEPELDRAIVEDGLRAMCLDHALVDGSHRTRARCPEAAIEIDARACRVSTTHRRALEPVAPRYWLSPVVAARMLGVGIERYELQIAEIDTIPAAAAAICNAAPGASGDGFSLRAAASG
ncbi:MAG: hypothetical protein ACTHU0_10955, partial [Kofleriaceae bacterium]